MTRKEKAMRMRAEGYNCASSVLAPLSDLTGIDEETAIRMTASLGSGVGGCREICGAAVAMSMAAGALFPPKAAEKGNAAKAAHSLLERFAESNRGCLRCAQLKDRQLQGEVRSCNELVEQCVGLAEEFLEHKGE
ncbi:MAG: C_GCAxxG_C_C family protein [Bacteroides sp.]|nr:C_GCAxxG_C_C family protein [Bacteroides sp.]